MKLAISFRLVAASKIKNQKLKTFDNILSPAGCFAKKLKYYGLDFSKNHAELQNIKWLDGIKNLKIKKKNQASQIESE